MPPPPNAIIHKGKGPSNHGTSHDSSSRASHSVEKASSDAAFIIKDLVRTRVGELHTCMKLAGMMDAGPGILGVQRVHGLLAWKPLRSEFDFLADKFMEMDWKSPLPEFRVTYTLVKSGLDDIGMLRMRAARYWTAGNADSRNWYPEDYYCRAILKLLQWLQNCSKSGALTWWVTNRQTDNKIWILYHALLYRQIKEKRALWEELRYNKKILALVSGQYCKELIR